MCPGNRSLIRFRYVMQGMIRGSFLSKDRMPLHQSVLHMPEQIRSYCKQAGHLTCHQAYMGRAGRTGLPSEPALPHILQRCGIHHGSGDIARKMGITDHANIQARIAQGIQ